MKLEESVFEYTKLEKASFVTAEGIALKPIYTEKYVENWEHLDFAAGFSPYTRGAKTTMYVQKPWTTRESINLNDIIENNKNSIESEFNDKVPEITIDTILKVNYKLNNEDCNSKNKSKSIKSVEDMKLLLNQFPLYKTKISIPFDDSVVELVSFYIIASKEKGISTEKSIDRLELNLFSEPNSFQKNWYTSDNLTSLIKDIFELTSQKIPEINFHSIPEFFIAKNDFSIEIELGKLLAKGFEFLQEGIKLGLKIDDFAPCISFSMEVGKNHFMEIAKLRAARMLWAKLVLTLQPKNNNSLVLKIYSITSIPIANKDPLINITQTIVQAKAAIFGGTDALETPLVDIKNELTARYSDGLELKMHAYLQEETKICKTVDPWGGSFYVEDLTHRIAQKAWEQIEKVIQFGGYTKALESGLLNLKTEASI